MSGPVPVQLPGADMHLAAPLGALGVKPHSVGLDVTTCFQIQQVCSGAADPPAASDCRSKSPLPQQPEVQQAASGEHSGRVSGPLKAALLKSSEFVQNALFKLELATLLEEDLASTEAYKFAMDCYKMAAKHDAANTVTKSPPHTMATAQRRALHRQLNLSIRRDTQLRLNHSSPCLSPMARHKDATGPRLLRHTRSANYSRSGEPEHATDGPFLRWPQQLRDGNVLQPAMGEHRLSDELPSKRDKEYLHRPQRSGSCQDFQHMQRLLLDEPMSSPEAPMLSPGAFGLIKMHSEPLPSCLQSPSSTGSASPVGPSRQHSFGRGASFYQGSPDAVSRVPSSTSSAPPVLLSLGPTPLHSRQASSVLTFATPSAMTPLHSRHPSCNLGYSSAPNTTPSHSRHPSIIPSFATPPARTPSHSREPSDVPGSVTAPTPLSSPPSPKSMPSLATPSTPPAESACPTSSPTPRMTSPFSMAWDEVLEDGAGVVADSFGRSLLEAAAAVEAIDCPAAALQRLPTAELELLGAYSRTSSASSSSSWFSAASNPDRSSSADLDELPSLESGSECDTADLVSMRPTRPAWMAMVDTCWSLCRLGKSRIVKAVTNPLAAFSNVGSGTRRGAAGAASAAGKSPPPANSNPELAVLPRSNAQRDSWMASHNPLWPRRCLPAGAAESLTRARATDGHCEVHPDTQVLANSATAADVPVATADTTAPTAAAAAAFSSDGLALSRGLAVRRGSYSISTASSSSGHSSRSSKTQSEMWSAYSNPMVDDDFDAGDSSRLHSEVSGGSDDSHASHRTFPSLDSVGSEVWASPTPLSPSAQPPPPPNDPQAWLVTAAALPIITPLQSNEGNANVNIEVEPASTEDSEAAANDSCSSLIAAPVAPCRDTLQDGLEDPCFGMFELWWRNPLHEPTPAAAAAAAAISDEVILPLFDQWWQPCRKPLSRLCTTGRPPAPHATLDELSTDEEPSTCVASTPVALGGDGDDDTDGDPSFMLFETWWHKGAATAVTPQRAQPATPASTTAVAVEAADTREPLLSPDLWPVTPPLPPLLDTEPAAGLDRSPSLEESLALFDSWWEQGAVAAVQPKGNEASAKACSCERRTSSRAAAPPTARNWHGRRLLSDSASSSPRSSIQRCECVAAAAAAAVECCSA